jgi:hypothetical protein
VCSSDLTGEAAGVEGRGEAMTARTVTAAARISQNTACSGLGPREMGTMEDAAMLSDVH